MMTKEEAMDYMISSNCCYINGSGQAVWGIQEDYPAEWSKDHPFNIAMKHWIDT